MRCALNLVFVYMRPVCIGAVIMAPVVELCDCGTWILVAGDFIGVSYCAN